LWLGRFHGRPLRTFMLIAENYRIELHLRPMLHRAHFDYKGGQRTFAAVGINGRSAGQPCRWIRNGAPKLVEQPLGGRRNKYACFNGLLFRDVF
jgi:hypothetical protein